MLLSSATIISSNLEQLDRAPAPTKVTEPGIVNDVREEHLENAVEPISVTELGIVTEVTPEHPENASMPILVTELGIVTEVKLEHPRNAEKPISVTELGISTDSFARGQHNRVFLFLSNNMPLNEENVALSSATIISLKFWQLLKRLLPIPSVVTVLGMVTDVRSSQPSNA